MSAMQEEPISVRHREGKDYVLCAFRHRFVRLTPEEWVRQHVLGSLVRVHGFPKGLIAVEACIRMGSIVKRCDAIVYGRDMKPIIIVECKADEVELTQTVLDQACVYNKQLHVPYLMLSNGRQTIVAHIDDDTITFLNDIPTWTQLSV